MIRSILRKRWNTLIRQLNWAKGCAKNLSFDFLFSYMLAFVHQFYKILVSTHFFMGFCKICFYRGLDLYLNGKNPLVFKKKINFACWKNMLSKFVTLPKLNRDEYSALFFFLLDHSGWIQVCRLVAGQLRVWLQKNRDFSTEENILIVTCTFRGTPSF